MTEYEMAMAALQRPTNYRHLSAERQWEIDKSLGILDWNGINLDAARKAIEEGNPSEVARRFKMSLPELTQVVRLFDAKYPPKEA